MTDAAPPSVPAGWDGVLQPGERILWQGRPDATFTLRGHSKVLMLVGGLFSAVALVFIAVGVTQGIVAFMVFPLVHLAVGLGLLVGAPMWRSYRWRNTWYTLTDRRAIIATDHWPKGRDLRLYPLGPDTPLAIATRPMPVVQFANVHIRTKHGTRLQPLGFERIPDAEAVFEMISAIKQGKP